MRTYEQIRRDQLIDEIQSDVARLKDEYRFAVPKEATRALNNLVALSALLVKALRELEGEHGSKAG